MGSIYNASSSSYDPFKAAMGRQYKYTPQADTETGAFVQRATSMLDASMNSEFARRQRLVSQITPGISAFRSGIAAQGMTGGAGNAMAKAQRDATLAKNRDYIEGQADMSKYDMAKVGILQQGQELGLRRQAQGFQEFMGQSQLQAGVDQNVVDYQKHFERLGWEREALDKQLEAQESDFGDFLTGILGTALGSFAGGYGYSLGRGK